MNDYQIISINFEKYLGQFIKGYLGVPKDEDVIPINRTTFIGNVIIDSLQREPQNCRYIPYHDKGKDLIAFKVGFMGSGTYMRKNPNYYYYLPRDGQLLIERYVRDLMNNLLFSYVDLMRKSSDRSIKSLIYEFCEKYSMDMTHFDTLAKKYYRYRTALLHPQDLTKNKI